MAKITPAEFSALRHDYASAYATYRSLLNERAALAQLGGWPTIEMREDEADAEEVLALARDALVTALKSIDPAH